MNVSLSPELEQYVHDKVQGGLYLSASEVVREGLRLLKQRDDLHQRKLEQLRRDIQVGIDQADRGQARPLSESLISDIKARGRKRMQIRKAHDSK